MKTLRVGYTGFWQGFDYQNYAIHQLLSKHYQVEVCENPDILFYSIFNPVFSKEDTIRVGYIGENICPDFNIADYAISFENIAYKDRHIRVPNWIMNPKYNEAVEQMQHKHEFTGTEKTGFCSFVVSNGNADAIRTEFFELLSGYKQIASGGRYMNNIGCPQGVPDKLAFQKQYKFAMAFENSSHLGYTTEKLVEAFAARTVPIYWGDPDIEKTFNGKAFINVAKYETLEEAVAQIRRVDEDEALYQQMLQEPALKDTSYVEQVRNELEAFLLHIAEQPKQVAFRRCFGIVADKHLQSVITSTQPQEKRFWRRRK